MKQVKECTNCEVTITEGYEIGNTVLCAYCGHNNKQGSYKIWLEWDSITSEGYEVRKGFRLHDNLYFTRSTAELFNDGKDRIQELYFVVTPDEAWYEGGQIDDYHTQPTQKLAEELAEELAE